MTREGFVLEIRRGQGEPRFLRLPYGSDLQPTSFGARGDFRVDGDGVLDVHGFVYFDGETLFVQSAEPAMPVRVNGRPAASEWTRVEPPATLAFGDARVVFCPSSQASTVSAPMPARPAAGVRPPPVRDMEDLPTIADVPPPIGDYDDVVTERVQGHDQEATSSIPVPGARTPPAEHPDDETTRALPLPVAPAPVARPAPPVVLPSVLPSVITAPEPVVVKPVNVSQPIAAPPPVVPTVEKPSVGKQLAAQWKEASLPKKAILFLLPVAFVMVVFGLDEDQPKKKPRPTPSASASALAAKPSVTPTQEPTLEEEPKVAKPAPSAPAPAAASNKTPERAAVDAVAAGSYAQAADLYDDLAKSHPQNQAYKEAARILRAKAKK